MLITVIATAPDGRRGSKTIDIMSVGVVPIEISASPVRGIAPLTVRFTLTNTSGNALTQIGADYDGDSRADFATADPNATFEYSYTVAGIYRATFTVTDTQHMTYTKTILIVVYDPVQIDHMLQATWSGMNSALLAGDTTQALQHFNPAVQAKYGPVLEVLLPDFPRILASYSSLQLVSLSGSIGEYAINRTIDGTNYIFLIYFLQDADGVWRIASM